MNIFLYFGTYGPILLVLIGMYILKYNILLEGIFVIGFVINLVINSCLKMMFKEARPKGNPDSIKGHKDVWNTINQYGFPSGHNQSAGYCIVIIISYTMNMWLLLFSWLNVFMIAYERYIMKHHSIRQELYGLFIGGFVGYITTLVMKYYQ